MRQEGRFIIEKRKCRKCNRSFESKECIHGTPGAFYYGQSICPNCAQKELDESKRRG